MSAPKKALLASAGGIVLVMVAVTAAPQSDPTGDNTRVFTYGSVDGKGGEEVSGAYHVVLNWPQRVHEGWTVGGDAVYAESPDRIYVAGRGERKDQFESVWGPGTIRLLGRPLPEGDRRHEHIVVVYNREGRLIEWWEQWDSTIENAARIQVSPYDAERHIWITTGSSIFQFTHDGKRLVRRIDAKDIPGVDPRNPPVLAEELAWMPNGDFYVAGGPRVTKFSKDGKYLAAYGEIGKGPSQFGTSRSSPTGGGVHGIALDPTRNRMYVADRVNSRIQVLDVDGKYLDHWPNIIAPYSIRLTKDGRYLWVADGFTMKVGKYEALTGKLVSGSSWGTFGVAPGTFWAPHHFTTDGEGNLYVAEDYNARVQKFVPRKDGNPEQIIGPLQ